MEGLARLLAGRQGVPEEEPAGPGSQGRVDVLVHVERGQHHHPGIAVGGDRRGGIDAVQNRHPNIRQNDVGLLPSDLLDRFCAGGRFPDQAQIRRFGDDPAQPGADERLVVDDHHPHAHRSDSAECGADTPKTAAAPVSARRAAGSGSRAATRKPPPGSG